MLKAPAWSNLHHHWLFFVDSACGRLWWKLERARVPTCLGLTFFFLLVSVCSGFEPLQGSANGGELWYLCIAVSSREENQRDARKAPGVRIEWVLGWDEVSWGSLKPAQEQSHVWLKPTDWDHWFGGEKWKEGHTSSARNKKRLIHVHRRCVIQCQPRNGSKHRSDGILFVSEQNHHAVQWEDAVQDLKAVGWLRGGGGLESGGQGAGEKWWD